MTVFTHKIGWERLAAPFFLPLLFLSGCTSHTAQSGVGPGAGPAAASDSKLVRIGYHKGGNMNIVRLYGDLDKTLAAQGVQTQWIQFSAGPQVLEGIGAGSVDIGATGDTPPIFAQAAGVPITYVANIPPGDPAGQAVIVPKNSPIHTVADLKGKRIAFAKGSGAHYFLVRVLAKAGLKYSDIKPTYLAPADASAAFAGGSIDAWVIWEPFLTLTEQKAGARVLADQTGLPWPGAFFLASRSFAQSRPEWVKIIVDEAQKSGDRAFRNPDKAAQKLAPQIGLPVQTLALLIKRGGDGRYRAMTPSVIAAQQKEADTFFALGLLPHPVKIQDDVLPAQTAQAKQ